MPRDAAGDPAPAGPVGVRATCVARTLWTVRSARSTARQPRSRHGRVGRAVLCRCPKSRRRGRGERCCSQLALVDAACSMAAAAARSGLAWRRSPGARSPGRSSRRPPPTPPGTAASTWRASRASRWGRGRRRGHLRRAARRARRGRGGPRRRCAPRTSRCAGACAAGDRWRPGQLLGRCRPGHHGCPVAACLHWGLLRGDTYLDPMSLLGARRGPAAAARAAARRSGRASRDSARRRA